MNLHTWMGDVEVPQQSFRLVIPEGRQELVVRDKSGTLRTLSTWLRSMFVQLPSFYSPGKHGPQQNMKCVQEDEAAHTQYQRPAVTVICVRKTREPAIILSSLWSF